MARRYSTVTDVHAGTEHLECPRCGHHSVVSHGEGRFACVRCGWHRDVSENWEPVPIYVLIALVTIIIIITTG
ncbi:MAG: hypothetical protein AAFR58_14545 [Cyanobacteria bacterium J06627_28]